MKNKFYLIFCFLFVSQYSLANCLEPYENLNNFYNYKSFQADFIQNFSTPDQNKLKGKIFLKKPNNLKLTINKPSQSETIINNNSVFRIDYELDQAVKYKKENIIDQIPAAFLLLSPEKFCMNLEKVNCSQGACNIIPIDKTYISSISLIFEKSILSKISYTNSFEEKSSISFFDFDVNPELSTSLFRYNQEVSDLITLE